MSTWWDEDKKRYRSNLPYKIFYVWGWPVIQFAMNRLPGDIVHEMAIPGVKLIHLIGRVWEVLKLALVLPVIVLILLLCKLPWFCCEPPTTPERTET